MSRSAVSPVRHLVRARDLADARYTEPLTVDDLAAAACLSRAHFCREFRRAFGESPYSYLLSRRLERAATLLRGTDYFVTDICMQVGLSSVGSFTSSFVRAYGVTHPIPHRPGGVMIRISTTQLWVHDQDEALEFWTTKVGFEVREDVTVAEMGNFRWLTVGPVDQPGIALVLMTIPGPPMIDGQTSSQIAELTAKGYAGTLFLATDDAMKAYEELSARGVEFTEKPTPQPYGIDCGFRDPSGNSVRLAQRSPVS